jgi:hypothetical protein
MAEGLVFFAEDAFGDQYAFRFSRSGVAAGLVKFWCEGGEIEELNAGDFEAWLLDVMRTDGSSILNRELAATALQKGLRPSITEHLGFALPLITGGKEDVENIEVVDRAFHLHVLGQLSLKNHLLPEGERIARFWSES